MRRPDRKRLVVDADVARAAGRRPELGTANECWEFLHRVRSVCHRVAMTPELLAEWKRHESIVTREWRASMMSLGKVVLLPSADEAAMAGLEEGVAAATAALADDVQRERTVAEMRKDLHLLTAARATDRIVVSLDDRARRAAIRLVPHCPDLATFVWRNPSREHEATLTWLEDGAPHDPAHCLGHNSE